MSEEGNKKLYEHYTNLAAGTRKTGNPVRDDLIVSDAKKHLADLISKNPELDPIKIKEKQDLIKAAEKSKKDAEAKAKKAKEAAAKKVKEEAEAKAAEAA